MGYDPYESPYNLNSRKKPIWLVILIAIGVLFIFGGILNKINNQDQASRALQNEISTTENQKEKFSKLLENNIRADLGNSYGSLIIDPFVRNTFCRFTLTFKRNLTDKEAREAGNLAVRAMLAGYAQTGKIEEVSSGDIQVAVWVYSWQQLPAGELRERTNVLTYMGQAIYKAETDQIYWTYKRW